ncbi:MAG: hypothetical protein IKZ48_02055 [Prevotella sp.]|nr:hypothetical protein [Prevotella sp.]
MCNFVGSFLYNNPRNTANCVPPKSALVRIKAGTPNETRVRGYRLHFKIDLPEELMQIAYESGLGEKGSMGFGMIANEK